MNSQRAERFDALGRLFRYPGDDYAADACALAARLQDEASAAAGQMADLARYTERVSLHELEESYTRAFDLNPACAPEIGWHLFGEEYVRGLFMVRMRNEMRQYGLEETGELPDHVTHVLAVLAAMDERSAGEFARACVCPAVGKMLASLDGGGRPLASGKDIPGHRPARTRPPVKAPDPAADGPPSASATLADQPFRPLVVALAELLLEEFELPRTALEAKEEEDRQSPTDVDPLHTMPCGGCGGSDPC